MIVEVETKADLFEAVDRLIYGDRFQKDGMTVEEACSLFEVSTSGYYNWRQQKMSPKEKEKEAWWNDLKEKISQIIRKLGFVPGARTFRTMFDRLYNLTVSRKKCSQLMREMGLVANMPKKDPYKHQATHDHEYAAPAENLLNRNFFVGPRKVILTDITYLCYGADRETFYLCVFRDAFTKEILGWKTSQHMTVADLVQPAYEDMLKNAPELRGCKDVLVHSDQGSQYMSATFQQLLEDDELVQSVSGRGNSLDNSPMESFFGRLKTNVMDIVALARDYDTAAELVSGYIDAYNNEHYQYALAGLTPHEYYLYITTGIYPCDSYFGVDASRLDTPEELIRRRREEAERAAARDRERAQKNREKGIHAAGKDPMKVVNRDIRIIEKEQEKLARAKAEAETRLAFLTRLLERAEKAREFILNATEEMKTVLRDRQEWRKHPQLSYVFDMKGLF